MEDKKLEGYMEKVDDLLNYYQGKYGKYTEIVYLLMMDVLAELLSVKQQCSDTDAKSIVKKVKELHHQACQIMNYLKTPVGNYDPTHRFPDGSIEFDEKYYLEKYDGLWKRYSDDIVCLNNENIFEYANFKWYLYVLTKEKNLVIYKVPFLQIDTLIDRTNYPKHVFLAHKSNLKVLCAGEILLGTDKYGNLISVVNNRSGHYKPNMDNLLIMEQYLKTLMDEIYIIDCSRGEKIYVCGN